MLLPTMARKRESSSSEHAAGMTDVLVLGTHGSGYLVAALLARAGLTVRHATVDTESADADRLALVNPALFDLHELLKPMLRRLNVTPLYGLRLVPPVEPSATRYTSRSAVAMVVKTNELNREFARLAERDGVHLTKCHVAEALSADETGVHLSLDAKPAAARLLVISDVLPAQARTVLHVEATFEQGSLHRFTWLICKSAKLLVPMPKPGLVLSMDIDGKMLLGWLIPGDGEFQVAVAQPVETVQKLEPVELLRRWMDRLVADHALSAVPSFRPSQLHGINLALAGALGGENVGNRTLLIGPAGGFVSSTAEDVYPGCWSAVCAAEVAQRALKEPHLQDGLNPYRQQWRTTLGEYLRGPRQNLPYLLPLVYRNEVMTERLAEAILAGKPVVR